MRSPQCPNGKSAQSVRRCGFRRVHPPLCRPSALHDAVIWGFFFDGVLRGAAELRLLEHPGEAEAALSIERAWQSRGVGSALFERVLLVARNRQIESSA